MQVHTHQTPTENLPQACSRSFGGKVIQLRLWILRYSNLVIFGHQNCQYYWAVSFIFAKSSGRVRRRMSRVIPLFHSSFPSTPHQGKTLPISRTCMKNQWNNLVVLLRSVTCSMQNWYISKPHMSRPSLHIGQSVVSYTVATLGTENRTVFLWKLVLTAELTE